MYSDGYQLKGQVMRVRAHPGLLPKKSVFEMTEIAGIVVASNSWTEHTALARCNHDGT